MGKSVFDDMVVDDCISQTDFDIDELTPLTSAEIIEFLPESGKMNDTNETSQNECELCVEKATLFCDCEQCRESCVSYLVNYSDDELIDGRWLCKECAL